MKRNIYLAAAPYGIYMYLLFHLTYWARFGRINTSFSYMDLFIVLVGVLSVWIFIFFSKRLKKRRMWLWAPFILAVPFGYLGSLGGGLIGPLGILIFGLIPFGLLIPIGYWLIKKSYKKS